MKFGPKILKQWMKISNAAKLNLKNLNALNSKHTDIDKKSLISLINKKTIHVIPPTSIQEYQSYDNDRLNNEVVNVLHAITPISDRINFY